METDADVRDVIERYGAMLFRLAYARTRNRMDAEDLCQEAILRLVDKNPAFRDEEHKKAWLIRTVLYLAGNLFRSAWRRHTVAPAEDARAQEANGALEDALAALPGRDRAVIHLFYYVGMTTEEIASALRRRPSTVRAQLTRARRRLRDLLTEEG